MRFCGLYSEDRTCTQKLRSQLIPKFHGSAQQEKLLNLVQIGLVVEEKRRKLSWRVKNRKGKARFRMRGAKHPILTKQRRVFWDKIKNAGPHALFEKCF